MNIAVVGTGYVGLVSGTCFAEIGNNVICVDVDNAKIEKLKSGKLTIYEPGLEHIFERNIGEGRIKFTTSLEEGIKNAQIVFLALPTPPNEDGSADLRYVLDVAEKIGQLLTDYKIIVNKSTVPVGTAVKVREAIAKHYKGEFDVVSNPEFLREGVAVDDFLKPERVVIGTQSERAKKVMEELYLPFVKQGNPIYFMDEPSAELTKYAANSFLANKISFMNEIANLCELVGANVDSVRIGIGSDSRIGKRFLFPGIGYGGSCFPKDVQALVKASKDVNYDFSILNSVIQVNNRQKEILIPKIEKYFNGDLNNKKIAVWGLAFKPNTDDIREAPSIEIIKYLLSKGSEVTVFDPEAISNVKGILGDKIKYAGSHYDALIEADALIIATEWNEFRLPDWSIVENNMKQHVIFDGRNLYELSSMKKLNFDYFSIGRPSVLNRK